jgi:hypothetical protein
VLGLGRAVAVALDGDRVDDGGAAAGTGAPQGETDCFDIVAVDRSDVLEAERLRKLNELAPCNFAQGNLLKFPSNDFV